MASQFTVCTYFFFFHLLFKVPGSVYVIVLEADKVFCDIQGMEFKIKFNPEVVLFQKSLQVSSGVRWVSRSGA